MSRRGLQGQRPWIFQRLTAIYLAVYFVYFIVALLAGAGADYESWRAWLTHPLMFTATGLFFGALLLHAWIGVRDVILDYVHPFALRLTALTLVGLFLLGCGLWALKVLILATLG
ncbi:MAG: succinate dehydrogenase, hydrophobic membrane anchor protein [Chromatiales bacterium]|nr:succinate dehydrogenase, hydrophobic membrane anchor protein [Chromatiales bacterium]